MCFLREFLSVPWHALQYLAAHELSEVFGIYEKPSAANADRLYDLIAEKLASPEFSHSASLPTRPVADVVDARHHPEIRDECNRCGLSWPFGFCGNDCHFDHSADGRLDPHATVGFSGLSLGWLDWPKYMAVPGILASLLMMALHLALFRQTGPVRIDHSALLLEQQKQGAMTHIERVTLAWVALVVLIPIEVTWWMILGLI